MALNAAFLAPKYTHSMEYASQYSSLNDYILHTPEQALHALMTPPPNGYADEETYSQVAHKQTVKWANMIFIAARKIEEFAEVSGPLLCT